MNSIVIKAYAKINLGLDVLKKREDGYHDVSMIMQSVNLYDTLTISRSKFPDIKVKSNLAYLPADQRNLAYKAAQLFKKAMHIGDGIEIILIKRIPVAAGLAGGSSDAAAVLKGLNQLFHTGLSMDELKELGVKLGADIPYCILLGTALSEGIGEVLTPLKPMPACTILLVKPDISVSTKYVYENIKLDPAIKHPEIQKMRKALEVSDLKTLTATMDNILQTVTIKEYPVIEEIKSKMKEHGALVSLMSGSGPTVFGIYDNSTAAQSARQYFKDAGYGKFVALTEPYHPDDSIDF